MNFCHHQTCYCQFYYTAECPHLTLYQWIEHERRAEMSRSAPYWTRSQSRPWRRGRTVDRKTLIRMTSTKHLLAIHMFTHLTKQCTTHRVVCVVWEELHVQHLFLLSDSGQKGREEQQRAQVPQQVWAVPQHALTTAGQHSHTHIYTPGVTQQDD